MVALALATTMTHEAFGVTTKKVAPCDDTNAF
jgi:hypothetical protein